MKRVGRDARLDEASVSNADQRAVEWQRPVVRRPRVAAAPVTTIAVHPQVWAAAVRLAGGDTSRLEVRSATEVTVHNGAWRKQKGIPS